MSEEAQHSAELTASLRAAFAVHEVEPDKYIVQTPFQFEDGDGYPVVIEKQDDGWHLTDLGGTASHLAGDEIDFTPTRLDMLVDIAEGSGFDFRELMLSRVQGDLPSQFDLADILQAIAQLAAIRYVTRDQVGRLYRDDVAQFVEARVPKNSRTIRWCPSTDSKGIYAADALLIPTSASRPTTLFAVGNAEQAERTTISILMHKRWNLEVEPLVVYDRRVDNRIGSPRIYHLQDAAGDDAVIPAAPGEWTSVERILELRNVPLSAA